MDRIKKNKRNFLKNIERSKGHIGNACRLTGITSMTLSNYKRDDEEFRLAVEDAVFEAKTKFAEDLTQAFIHKTLGEKVQATDDRGEPLVDDEGNPIMEYKGGDTVAMIWASKNVMGWTDKQKLEVEGGGGKVLLFTPAQIKELPEAEEIKDESTDR